MKRTCGLFHLHENKGTDLTWRVDFAVSLQPRITVRRLYNLVRDVLPVNSTPVKIYTASVANRRAPKYIEMQIF